MSTAASTQQQQPAALTTPPAQTFEVSSELQKILARHDQGGCDDLKRLLAGQVLFNKLTPEVMATKGRIEQAILIAEGIEYLKSVLNESVVNRYFMPLQNNPRGFMTDRKPTRDDPGGYPWWIVRDCLIDALSRGLPASDNHFNIIQERMYITRNGCTFLLEQLKGLTDLRIDAGVPETVSGGAVVPVRATWKWNNRDDHMEKDVAVKVNNGQGFDAMLGKADRKFKAALYSRLTGTVFTEEGEIDEDLPSATPRPGTGAPVRTRSEAILESLRAQTAKPEGKPGGNPESRPVPAADPRPEPEAPALGLLHNSFITSGFVGSMLEATGYVPQPASKPQEPAQPAQQPPFEPTKAADIAPKNPEPQPGSNGTLKPRPKLGPLPAIAGPSGW